MRRIFGGGRRTWVTAIGAAVLLVSFGNRAFCQLLDPGWQVASPTFVYGANSGVVGGVFADEAPVVGVYQQRSPMYYQAPPRPAYQPAPMYYQTPQRAYEPPQVYYQQVPPQPQRSYQPAPIYYQQGPSPQLQPYRPPATYMQPTMQQPAPQYYASASPQQVRAVQYGQPVPQQSYQPAQYAQPAPQPGYQAAQYAQPAPQQSYQRAQYAQQVQTPAAYPVGQYAQAAPVQAAYQQQPGQYQQPAPQQNGFAFLFRTPAPAPAYAPSSYGDMAHQPVDPQFNRQVVAYQGSEQPGTIIIDTPHYFLYLVLGNGQALRYGIGVGRPGFTWSGVKQISAMREWPDWYPPPEMLARRPDLPRYMPGGEDNPLGARALYLGSTLYRIHGSNEPWTIGTQVSSGCIRLRNEDVVDLYSRVKVGTKVIII